jgi:hypothetical protein
MQVIIKGLYKKELNLKTYNIILLFATGIKIAS